MATNDLTQTVEMTTDVHTHEHRDDYGSKLGMWLFLFTELVLFGGLFLLYMSYRVEYFPEFQLAAKQLKVSMGGLNTVILLTSSLTMVLSIVALQRGSIRASLNWLATTIAFAGGFMVVKYFEWTEKISHGIYPNSPDLLDKSRGEIIFYGLYYTMTGLHGVHIIIGMVLLSIMYYQIKKKKITPDRYIRLESAGLYWHLVDLIWIFLFPLYYLLH